MTFEYNWSRDDLKKELINKRYKTNFIYLIIGVMLYILFMYKAIMSELFDKLIILIGGVIFTAVFMLVLFIATKIYVLISLRKNDRMTNKAYGTYHISLNDSGIIVSINDTVINYNYQDIIKFQKKKHSFFIRTREDKVGLLFKEHVIGKDNYRQILEHVQKHVSC